MKRLAIIFGSVLLAIVVLAVSLYSIPKPAVTIRAVRATGDSWYKPHPQPIWTFAITNTGPAPVYWQAGVETKGGNDPHYSRAGGFADWPEDGMVGLAPGCGFETNMIVPAIPGSVWRGSISFRRVPGAVEWKLWRLGYRIPGYWRLFHFNDWFTYADVWRQTTNVVPQPPQTE